MSKNEKLLQELKGKFTRFVEKNGGLGEFFKKIDEDGSGSWDKHELKEAAEMCKCGGKPIYVSWARVLKEIELKVKGDNNRSLSMKEVGDFLLTK